MKKIAVLGSTGSIGLNVLNIVRTHPDQFSVKALAVRRNADGLFQQAREFRPEVVCLFEKEKAGELEKKLRPLGIRLVTGEEGLCEIAKLPHVEQVIFALVGVIGLRPIFSAAQSGKELAIANKEPLVVAGKLLVEEAKKRGAFIYPIDSEHSGIWQCLEGRNRAAIKKLILTTSGGPFRSRKGSFRKITPAEALKHPKWKMGPKITIDSATLMNKGLEVIEAVNLFDVSPEQVEVLVHPEAIIHALVEFVDGTMIANLGITDMRLPIQYAMSYPERLVNHLPSLKLSDIQNLHFDKPSLKRFPCLELGYEASRQGGSMPAVLNAANEVAVEAFLQKRISFLQIPKTIEKVMNAHERIRNPDLEDLFGADRWALEYLRYPVQKCGVQLIKQ